MAKTRGEGKNGGRLFAVDLDENSIQRGGVDAEHERAAAIHDLLDANSFQPVGYPPGRYRLNLSLVENRLVFAVFADDGSEVVTHTLSLAPLRKVMRDYFVVCDSYYAAVRNASPAQIEAIDMDRRGLHDEGAALLRQRLKGKLDFDSETARRLFTLVCALRWKS